MRVCGKPKLSDGEPCQQVLGNGRECIWHGPQATPEARQALARKGGLIVTHRQLLPPSTPVPRWRSRSQIVSWLERQARLVLVGLLDPKVAGEARLHAETALKAYELAGLEKLEEYEAVVVNPRRP